MTIAETVRAAGKAGERPKTLLTAEQYSQLGRDPVGVRLELVNGEILVSPRPNYFHSSVVINLIGILQPYLRQKTLGQLLQDLDTPFDKFTVRRPDILFIAADRIKSVVLGNRLVGVPDLAVEVVSPHNVETDTVDKFALYEKHGIRWYWIIDPEDKTAKCFELREEKYVLAAAGKGADVVRFVPFGELEILLGEIWPT